MAITASVEEEKIGGLEINRILDRGFAQKQVKSNQQQRFGRE
jgi:hypothetical protein